MTAIHAGRLLIEKVPGSGAWNMAVDETILSAAIRDDDCTIRFYRWSGPTVSLGYFQDFSADAFAREFGSLAVVRRLSGGGAILHHHELTYSLAVPPKHPLIDSPSNLYLLAHQAILQTLAEHGIAAGLRGSSLNQAQEPFLCFGRGDPRDIVLEGFKIVGSAQRRRKGAVLQHGSLLWRRSEFEPQFPGLIDLHPAAASIDPLEFAQNVANCFSEALGLGRLSPAPLPKPWEEQAHEWEATRYAHPNELRRPGQTQSESPPKR